jgi:triosephosphate isomerase (TIM)
VSIHPPFSDLRTVQTLLEGEGIPVMLGAQHCYHEDRGAFTGEVSPQMLARLHVQAVLVGHSERRRLFAMSDGDVALTVRAVLRDEMTAIVCVGESESERDLAQTEERLGEQVERALSGLSNEAMSQVVLAYEPIWAIGTGRAATPEDAQGGCAMIRTMVAKTVGQDAAGAVRIQYGGSVNAQNAAELCAEPDIDGLLVGGASLEAASMVDILRAVGDCYRA